MSSLGAPKNGDFAAYVEHLAQKPADKKPDASEQPGSAAPADTMHVSARKGQTIEDVIIDGEEASDELLEELKDLENAPPLSDEELARQALEDPGADGDASTPE
jgi:hypothetical protein